MARSIPGSAQTGGSSHRSHPTDGAQGALAIAGHGAERFIVGASTVVSGQLGFAVLGYLRDGTLDPKFGVDGIATALPAPGQAALQALIVQRDGKIIAVGGGTDAAGKASNGACHSLCVSA
jgi:hypothetical protein